MKHVPLLVLIAVLSVGSAHAQAAYMHERENWSVFNLADTCVATSRPIAESNFAPYMALNLIYEFDSKEIRVAAYLWPNAFTKGEQITMGLRGFSSRELVELPATALTDYSVKSDRALTREEQQALGDQHALIVMADGPPNQMAAQVSPGFWSVVSDLKNCARFVEENR